MAKIGAALLALILIVFVLWPQPKPSSRPEADPQVAAVNEEAGTQKSQTSIRKESRTVVPVSPRVDVQTQWQSLLPSIKKADTVSQEDLDALYEEAGKTIRAGEDEFLRNIKMSALVNASKVESFFTVSAWLRYSQKPTAILQTLRDYSPLPDPSNLDVHHEANTEASRHEILMVYALREIRKKIEDGKVKLNEAETAALVTIASEEARSSKSLNMSLEAFQLLSTLKRNDVIEVALNTLSPKDRKLISEVLETP